LRGRFQRREEGGRGRGRGSFGLKEREEVGKGSEKSPSGGGHLGEGTKFRLLKGEITKTVPEGAPATSRGGLLERLHKKENLKTENVSNPGKEIELNIMEGKSGLN